MEIHHEQTRSGGEYSITEDGLKAFTSYPKFDNGDDSEGGFFTAGFAAMNSNAAAAKVTEFDDAVERFRGILVAKLKYAGVRLDTGRNTSA